MKTTIEIVKEFANAEGYSDALSDIMKIIKRNQKPSGLLKVAEFCAKKAEEKLKILTDLNQELKIKDVIKTN